ncbi:hypothetical protein ACIGEP_01415 [Microbacterium sp. NPDC077663]|uniref:hypothetical protein n=1 Tax=Microbacterium sp. NPDC077663 TaxID=3364189 RepID=UPI0037C7FB97
MRTSTILSEAWRNLASGTTRALLFAGLFAGLVGTLALADTLTISTLQTRAEQFRESGAAIRTLVAEGHIDADSCDALTAASPVSAAGALAAGRPVTFSVMPGSSVPSFDVTPGFADVIALDSRQPAGVWISEPLSDSLKASPGTILATTAGPLTIAGTFPWPDDGRDSRLGYAVLIPTRSEIALDECWATIWPTSQAADNQLRAAATVDVASTTPLNLSQVNKNHGTTFDGNAEYLARLTRGVPLLGALTALLLGYTASRVRRLEYAGALHAGATKASTLATALVETFVWAVTGALVAAAVLAVVARQDPGSFAPVFLTSAKVALIGVSSSLIGAAIAVTSIRERHLFRFFKDR